MKTKEEIFNQPYMDAKDLKIIIPAMGIHQCVDHIKEIRKEMQEKGYFVPSTKPLVALTKLVRKKFGF